MSLLDVPEDTVGVRAKFRENAMALGDLASRCLLTQGRTEAFVAVAIMVLVKEASEGSRLKTGIFKEIEESHGFSARSSLERYKELKKALLDFGKLSPMFKDITSSNVYRVLESLIEYGKKETWKMSGSEMPSTSLQRETEPPALKDKISKQLPPSFVKNQKLRESTLERVLQVKKRLNQQALEPWMSLEFMSPDEPTSLLSAEFTDPMDEKIAKYLLDGFSVQEILDFNPIYGRKRSKH
jgi:hypothetical protein